MTKHERKEKAYATVKAFIRCYKDDLKYATYEGIGRDIYNKSYKHININIIKRLAL